MEPLPDLSTLTDDDLRALLRSELDDAAVAKTIAAIWTSRDDRYSELRGRADTHGLRVEMNYVGG